MDYNGRLKPIHDKGLCGDAETVEHSVVLNNKLSDLLNLVQSSKYTVVFTGAGISTSCGIADFRGPNGVWTKEQRGEELDVSNPNTFNTAQPSFTHFAIACLIHAGLFHHVISQNVDGLHLRSGVPEYNLSELHGNIFKEKCSTCGKEYLRTYDVGGMGLNLTGGVCEVPGCKGLLKDMAVDWDTELPTSVFSRAHAELDKADLVLCLGTSLRIRPAGNMPLRVVKPKVARRGRTGDMVIVNLQKTHLDRKALKIHNYCDDTMKNLCERLGILLKEASLLSSTDMESNYTVVKNSIASDIIKNRNLKTGRFTTSYWPEESTKKKPKK
jgi:NAD+-dependent protein deacetylase sirtuin 6